MQLVKDDLDELVSCDTCQAVFYHGGFETDTNYKRGCDIDLKDNYIYKNCQEKQNK